MCRKNGRLSVSPEIPKDLRHVSTVSKIAWRAEVADPCQQCGRSLFVGDIASDGVCESCRPTIPDAVAAKCSEWGFTPESSPVAVELNISCELGILLRDVPGVEGDTHFARCERGDGALAVEIGYIHSCTAPFSVARLEISESGVRVESVAAGGQDE